MINFLLILSLFFFSDVAGLDKLPIRINCGSIASDFGFSGGHTYESSYVPSVSPFLLLTGRYFPTDNFGPENCYTFYVPFGFFYSVRVFFGIRNGNVPSFVVSLKGTVIHTLTSDWNKYDEETFVEIVHFLQDSKEYICFHDIIKSFPTIMSIEIFKLPQIFTFHNGMNLYNSEIYRTHTRMNFGTNMSNFDQNIEFGNRFWKGVSLLADNCRSFHTSKFIGVSGQYPAFIYETGMIASSQLPDLRFFIKKIVPRKTYLVSLHFCQVFGSPHSTVFEIRLGGNTVHSSFDVLKVAGGINRPVVVNYTMNVMSTFLMVYLKAARGSIAFINALEMHEVIEPEFNTLFSEVLALQKIKRFLRISDTFGWNGDPCTPIKYPWLGVKCSFDEKLNVWNIRGLTLIKQSLKGNLPEEFSEFSCLEFLDLSDNKFEGSIPHSYLRLRRLTLLNVSGNMLSGQVPKFSNSVSLSLDGNLGLCGYAGLPSCGGKTPKLLVLLIILLALLVSILILEPRSKRGKFH